jgi:hypothetical protein
MKRTDPRLWKLIVEKIKKGSKGGKRNQWSARKAQLAVKEYKKKGGGYVGKKSKSNSLVNWTKQEWGTKSGENSVLGPNPTGERYLPSKAIKALSKKEYSETSRAKRRSVKKGKQYSRQPKRISKKVGKYRSVSKKRKLQSKKNKVPKRLRSKAKKLGIRLTIKKNGKRVPKSSRVLKKQIRNRSSFPKIRERIKSIKVSPNKNKKYRAEIYNPKTKTTRNIDFGARDYEQFKDSTKIKKYRSKNHGDRKRRNNYFSRHSGVKGKTEALKKEWKKSKGKYNAKILSHKYLW